MSEVTGLKRIILLTGPPGIGKTSVFRRTIRELKEQGKIIGGVICHEVREAGVRVGFEIMDLSTGQRGWLAHVNQPAGPKIGKYTVNLTDLDVIGAGSILDAVKNADVLALDEIGPMEILSPAFSNALVKAVESGKPMVGTIHYTLSKIWRSWTKKGRLFPVFTLVDSMPGGCTGIVTASMILQACLQVLQ